MRAKIVSHGAVRRKKKTMMMVENTSSFLSSAIIIRESMSYKSGISSSMDDRRTGGLLWARLQNK